MNKLILFTVLAVICFGFTFSADKRNSFTSECFQINGTISFNISYMKSDDKLGYKEAHLSDDAKLNKYSCDNSTGIYAIIMDNDKSNLRIEFGLGKSKKKLQAIENDHWGVTKMSYNYNIDEANAKKLGSRVATADGLFFVTPNDRAYSCSKESVNLNVTTDSNNTVVSHEVVLLDVSGLQMDLFPSGSKENKTYNEYDYYYCKADQKVTDVVPIAVGVSLAALVVIVLVAYLIGRRRTVAAGGYERV